MKKILCCILLLAMCLSLFGCAKESSVAPSEDAKKDPVTEIEGEKTNPETEAETPVEENEIIELSYLIPNNLNTAGVEAVCALAEEKLGIHVELEVVSGADLQTIIMTRLAAGDANDLIYGNAGSYLQTFAPEEYFIDLSSQTWADRITDSYKNIVTIDGGLYGIPAENMSSIGIFYNKDIYEKYNLEVPQTWDEFIANCDTLKQAGEVAVIGSFGDSWTTQVPFLGDNGNLLAKEPDFVDAYNRGEWKYATSEAGLYSWQKLADLAPYYNEDYLATTFNDALDRLANGEGAHYFGFSSILGTIREAYGSDVNKIRAFANPDDDPEITTLTVGMPCAIYGNKNSEKVDAILRFMEFYISDEALNAYGAATIPDGAFCVKDYTPGFEGGYDAVNIDMKPYVDNGKTALMLEALSPVKGGNCAAICQEVGSGIISAEEGAKAYDDDCVKQAIQLGLDWK